MLKINRKEIYEIWYYSINGIASLLIYFFILTLALNLLNVAWQYSVTISFIISNVFNFIFNKKITFKSRNSFYKEIPKYMIVVALSYLITMLTMFNLHFGTKYDIYINSFIVIFISVVFKFLTLKYIVFKR